MQDICYALLVTALDSVDSLLSQCLHASNKLRAVARTLILMAAPSNVHTPTIESADVQQAARGNGDAAGTAITTLSFTR